MSEQMREQIGPNAPEPEPNLMEGSALFRRRQAKNKKKMEGGSRSASEESKGETAKQ